jgi:hypothetical protein
MWVNHTDDGGRKEIKKRENGKGKGKRKIGREKQEIKKKNGRLFWTFRPLFHITTRRRCFAKRFPKTDSAHSQNPLH